MFAHKLETYIELKRERMDERDFYLLLYNLFSSQKFRKLFSSASFLRKCKFSLPISIYNSKGEYIGRLPEKLNYPYPNILDLLDNLLRRNYYLSPDIDSISCESSIHIGDAILNEPVAFLCKYGESVKIKAREISLLSRFVIERIGKIRELFEEFGYQIE